MTSVVSEEWFHLPELSDLPETMTTMGSPRMTALTGTAACVARTGVTDDGVVVDAQTLIARVGWLAALCQELTTEIVTARWNPADLAALAAGVDSQGRPLPGKGSMVARRLTWGVPTPAGLCVPDRVHRAAEDHAVRLLRAAVIRGHQLDVLVATWPIDPNSRTDEEWTALRAAARAAGVDLPTVVVRNRTRNLATFLTDHGRLPSGVTEAEAPPRVAPMMLLAAADRQLVTLTRISATRAQLRCGYRFVPARCRGRTGRR